MTPTVIADSDGDDSDAACSPGRTAHISLPHESPDETTHPSGSTDPTFFKSIFNEQRDAAEKHATNHGEINDMEADIMDASSFDNGFQETRSAGIHADKSPWDVPSSPEFEQPPPRRSKKQDGISNTRTKITRGLRRRLDDIGYISQEDEIVAKGGSTKSRKKRRVGGAHTTSGELASTLPMESDPSFMVAPTALTTSQKELYSSIGGGATTSPGRPLEQRCINVMSSGTATNMNTPRSNEIPPTFEPSDIKSPKPTLTKATNRKRVSSPDAVAVLTPRSNTKHGARSTESTNIAKSKEVIDASDDEVEEQHVPVEAEQDNGSDLEEVPPPVQKKKQRGRPKKTDTTAPKEKYPVVNVKKKRGRPKKSEEVIKIDDEEEIQDAAAAITTAPIHSVESDIAQKSDLKLKPEHLPDTETEDTTPMTKQAPQTHVPDTKHDLRVVESTNKAIKTPSTPAGGSGRPLYRIGLSKNTRIAPLLKIIRK